MIRNGIQNQGIAVVTVLARPLLVVGVAIALVTNSTVEIRATVALTVVSVALHIDRTDRVTVTG